MLKDEVLEGGPDDDCDVWWEIAKQETEIEPIRSFHAYSVVW